MYYTIVVRITLVQRKKYNMITIIDKEELQRLQNHISENIPPSGYMPAHPQLIHRLFQTFDFLLDYRLTIESQLTDIVSVNELSKTTMEAIYLIETNYWSLYRTLMCWLNERNLSLPVSLQVAIDEYRKLYAGKQPILVNFSKVININNVKSSLPINLTLLRDELLRNKKLCSRYQFVSHAIIFSMIKTSTTLQLFIKINEEDLLVDSIPPAQMRRISSNC